MADAQRPMTLDEYVGALDAVHPARKELEGLRAQCGPSVDEAPAPETPCRPGHARADGTPALCATHTTCELARAEIRANDAALDHALKDRDKALREARAERDTALEEAEKSHGTCGAQAAWPHEGSIMCMLQRGHLGSHVAMGGHHEPHVIRTWAPSEDEELPAPDAEAKEQDRALQEALGASGQAYAERHDLKAHPQIDPDAPASELTVRALVAAKAIEGLCANPKCCQLSEEALAAGATDQADELIRRLNAHPFDPDPGARSGSRKHEDLEPDPSIEGPPNIVTTEGGGVL